MLDLLLAQTSPGIDINEDHLKAIAIVGGLTVAIVAIVTGAIRKTLTTRAREQSRREIAAYVAEGSISPDDAAKLLSKGHKKSCGHDDCG